MCQSIGIGSSQYRLKFLVSVSVSIGIGWTQISSSGIGIDLTQISSSGIGIGWTQISSSGIGIGIGWDFGYWNISTEHLYWNLREKWKNMKL